MVEKNESLKILEKNICYRSKNAKAVLTVIRYQRLMLLYETWSVLEPLVSAHKDR